jgi:IS30 family transposase
MKYRTRIHYTEEQKALMWDRWQERSARSLSLVEREEISRGIAVGRSLRSIARRLGRSPSTVSRELKRNGGRHGYRASRADEAAWDRARRPKICKLLARLVAGRLKLQWSPEEIAAWLRRTYPQDENRQVSHETIYKTLFIQARGALKKELLAHLRLSRPMRRPRGHTQKNRQIKQAVSIRGPCPVTGRATCSWVVTTARSLPWWNVIAVTACWFESRAKTPRR